MAAIAALKALRKSSSPCFAPFRTTFSQSIRRFISTLIVAEHDGGFVKPSTLSAIAAAEVVSKENSISVLLAGSGPSVEKAAQHAATCHPLVSEVLVAKAEELEHPMAESWAEIVKMVQQKGSYSHIMAASTSFGKNILPRAAAVLDVSPITDVVQISEPRLFVRPIYAGNALCTVQYTGLDPCMMTIRSTSFQGEVNPDAAKANPATITQIDISFLNQEIVGKSKWLSLSSQESERPDLGNARVVITGGRALKSAENFKLLEKLAEKLGAAVGATRAAVDAGYVPNDLQVGQTGKIVAPELYIAFGVSGAIQHLAGMRDSKVIVAVNKDADAPIFQVADYGLVADLFEVIPELLEKVPEKK
ncbi:electron transfer flavoprotein subunit alpha [Carex littledalei]|uniref:Electron transfer flavoprotein subunit alpha n=1 Tax=Carex littledalei TaxID=544730 RepID=A0A833VPZ9_9POAL|nr:electron transfer flavoprotein subunit alpha [Carex littledalei]